MYTLSGCDRSPLSLSVHFPFLTQYGVRFCVDRVIRHVVFYYQEDTHWSVTLVLRLLYLYYAIVFGQLLNKGI